MRRSGVWLTGMGALLALGAGPMVGEMPAHAQDATSNGTPELAPQTVLQPGLYLFQTRTRSGTCADAPKTGYVTSAVATLDGVPGSRSLTLRLLSSKWWPRWKLTVTTDGTILGTANMFGGKDPAKGTSRFEVRAYKDRFQGTGSREYPAPAKSEPARCTLLYDALLKPID